MIEVFLVPGEFKKRLSFQLKDFSINTMTSNVNYSHICQLMGPTFPPRVIGNSVLLSYDSNISFVFMYSEKEFKEGLSDLKKEQDNLLRLENTLVKINV
jgi:hypothetical protein